MTLHDLPRTDPAYALGFRFYAYCGANGRRCFGKTRAATEKLAERLLKESDVTVLDEWTLNKRGQAHGLTP